MYFFQLKDCVPEGDCENYKCIPSICNKQTDCGQGNKCIFKTCIIRCQDNEDCPEDKNCIDDYCSIPPGIHLCDLDFLLKMA